jgi:protein ImuA
MAMEASTAAADLSALRRRVAVLEGSDSRYRNRGPHALRFGIPAIDDALGGGLDGGAIHELTTASAPHLGAATGFGLALLALAARAQRARRDIVWISTGFAAAEGGRPYGLGLEACGIPQASLLVVLVARPADVWWAMEEALGCRGIAAAVAELTDDGADDLTATRRLSLVARDNGGFGLLLRQHASPYPSAAATRWRIAAAASRTDGFGGLGRTAFDLALLKNRRGPHGRWLVTWDHHERTFAAAPLPLGLVAPAVDRPDRAPFLRAG